jgi:nitric-oxide synthase, bacterial
MKLSRNQIRDQIEDAESLPALLLEAIEYLRLFYQEQSFSELQLRERLDEIYCDYRRSRTYWHTQDELVYGAKVAWRNRTRCIGHIFRESLNVRDLRHLTTAEDIFAAIMNHVQQATNGGEIRSTISIFAPDAPGQPGIRVWNPQLICYAGYRQVDGSILGDPAQAKLTKLCQHFGWQGQGSVADVLPLIIQMPGQKPQWFELPLEILMQEHTIHPEVEWFSDLGLKWYARPAVSNWRLEIGGVSYSCAPFNGWYMSAEMSARREEIQDVCLKPNFFPQATLLESQNYDRPSTLLQSILHRR